jgi:hypothetical protein
MWLTSHQVTYALLLILSGCSFLMKPTLPPSLKRYCWFDFICILYFYFGGVYGMAACLVPWYPLSLQLLKEHWGQHGQGVVIGNVGAAVQAGNGWAWGGVGGQWSLWCWGGCYLNSSFPSLPHLLPGHPWSVQQRWGWANLDGRWWRRAYPGFLPLEVT